MNSKTIANDCGDTSLSSNGLMYWCNNKNVTVSANFHYGNTIANSWLGLGSLPSKYKPRNNITFPIALQKSDGSFVTGTGIIEATNGSISVIGQNTSWITYTYIIFTVTFGID